jgi:hypothetical protein
MKFNKILILGLILFSYYGSMAQLTLETGVPSLSMTKSKFESTGFRPDSYLKIGYEKSQFGFGLTGITKSSLGLVGNEFFVGPYVNYHWQPNENSRIFIVPEVSVLYSQRQQPADVGFDNYQLLSANLGVGLEYKLNKNWSLTYSLAVGVGRERVEYADGTVRKPVNLTSSFPLMHSFGVKYTFRKRR